MTTKPQLLIHLKNQGFSNKIIKAFEKVKREDFISENLKQQAYEDKPLAIAQGATISQPYTIAFMLNLLELDNLSNKSNINNLKKSSSYEEKELNSNIKENNKIPKNNKLKKNHKISNNKPKILEIGSGSGYVLALIKNILNNSQIFGIERIKELVDKSKQVLKSKKNIKIINANGFKGLEKYSPYDRILISASVPKIPKHLYSQLKDNGIIVSSVQNSIFQIKKINNKIIQKEFPGFVFVPLVEG